VTPGGQIELTATLPVAATPTPDIAVGSGNVGTTAAAIAAVLVLGGAVAYFLRRR
jgi:hypothetical protein